MLARTYTAQTHLLKGVPITVEVDLGRGLYAFSIVGLPDKAIEEARDRVGAALKNSGFDSPKSKNEKVTVSLSPADLKKEGSGFDLAISLAYLLASEKINFLSEGKLFLGELSLSGEVRPISGTLPIIRAAREAGFSEVFVPLQNIAEASLVSGITVYGVPTLLSVVAHLEKRPDAELLQATATIPKKFTEQLVDMADIRGQESAKRGLEIAAAGGHNSALSGPPGTGKTLLAKAFAGILPPLSQEAMLEVTGIHSVAGALRGTVIEHPPFRAPHHTASYVSVIGGGSNPRPGEVTLAHRGVLFLDEFPEFDKRVIESLRQPLEDGHVTIARSKGSALFPANFMLVAAMNPCPCGFRGTPDRICHCSASDIARYERKLSGPIMDRIDITLSVGPVSYTDLDTREKNSEQSDSIRTRVEAARMLQKNRFADLPHIQTNSDMGAKEVAELIALSTEARTVLHESAAKLKLSARAYHRVQKLARTIADLAESEHVEVPHMLEALSYRPK
jgi:magnesium chelatase family protein